jgi:hypothetical protein
MQYVFILGGYDGEKCCSDVAIYSPDGAPSMHMAPGARNMISPRDGLASLFSEGNILAFGGHDGTNYLASCEIYSASTPGAGRFKKWTLLPGMSTSRAMHAAAHIDDGYASRMFVFGGQVCLGRPYPIHQSRKILSSSIVTSRRGPRAVRPASRDPTAPRGRAVPTSWLRQRSWT